MAGAVLLSKGFHPRLHHRGPGLQRPVAPVRGTQRRGAGRLARFGQVARQLLRKTGFQVPTGQRQRRGPVPGVRRDPGKEHVRPQGDGHRAQHLPDRPAAPHRRPVAQGARAGPRRRSARDPQGPAMMTEGKRVYVLDTNVLMHDPTALFKFEEHDVYLPMQVIEELDNGKKGMSESSRNARQVSRFINELIERQGSDRIASGLRLNRPAGLQRRGAESIGCLRFQTTVPKEDQASFGAVARDNRILGAILALRAEEAGTSVVFVSKDINLRIKAAIAGIPSEDYEHDRALDDFSLLYTGATALPADFWQRHGKDLKSWTDKGRTFYELDMAEGDDWHPNQFLYLPGDEQAEFRVARVEGNKATLQIVDDFRSSQHAVWGITARNREQNFALNALMDPEIDFVTLLGTAGTGKTLLALAAGLAQTMDQQRYREIIMTRATVSVGEDIGFLPGTEEEKMTPWMGAL